MTIKEETDSPTLEVQPEIEPTEVDQDDHDEDTGDESFPEDTPPPRKRRKSKAKSGGSTTKKQVRGKQGGLKDFMNLPIEVFTQIAMSLTPEDLLVLSRANKFFRSLLMRRSATQIWRRSLENVQDLPPCPLDMCEPQYAALLYSKYCLHCGKSVRRKIDTQLRIRMCPPCIELNTLGMYRVACEILVLVPRSIPANNGRSSYRHIKYLRCEVEAATAKLQELQAAGNQQAIRDWKEEQLDYVQERRSHGEALTTYFESIVDGREEELQMLKDQRRSEIKRRLAGLGWTDEKDLAFPGHTDTRRSWTALVDQPKPLTERIWENIQPKLLALLEANRQRRLSEERAERRRIRRRRLHELLEELQKTAPPLVEMPKSDREDPPSEGDPAVTPSAEKSLMVSLPTPFPKFADACQWAALKDLIEDEIPIQQLEELFVERRVQIDKETFEWRQSVEADLVERMGVERDCSELTTPELFLDNESFEDLAIHTIILLRADTLFYSPASTLKVPHSYGNAMALGRSDRKIAFTNEWFAGIAWNPSLIQFHSEASELARSLLESLGRPDATFLEFKDIRRFVCGRCHDVELKSWEAMVRHYLAEQRKWTKIEGVLSKFEELDIEYNYVHNPDSWDGPLVKLLTPQEASEIHARARCEEPFFKCKLCEKAGEKVIEPKESLLAHVRDVHSVKEPKSPEHYQYKMFDSSEVRPPQRRGFAASSASQSGW